MGPKIKSSIKEALKEHTQKNNTGGWQNDTPVHAHHIE